MSNWANWIKIVIFYMVFYIWLSKKPYKNKEKLHSNGARQVEIVNISQDWATSVVIYRLHLHWVYSSSWKTTTHEPPGFGSKTGHFQIQCFLTFYIVFWPSNIKTHIKNNDLCSNSPNRTWFYMAFIQASQILRLSWLT